MSQRRVALVCSVVSVACAPAELPGSDRADAGMADSQAFPDAPLETSTACRDASRGAFYVAPATGEDCNFPTISAALQAARASTAGDRTIILGRAVYSDHADFPIDLRGGISLEGVDDGSDGGGEHLTTLQGIGLASNVAAPSNGYAQLSNSAEVHAAILVGDPVKTSGIFNVSITTAMGSVPPGSEAIVCESGNAATVPPSPNTLVGQIAIRGFEVGVRVTWSKSPPSGCNLSLTSSIVRDGWYGVVADGYELAGKPAQTVSARIGDPVEGGNQFINLDIENDTALPFAGSGIATCDAVTGLVVVGNRFFSENSGLCDSGIWAVRGSGSYELPGFDIEGNEFGPLTNLGVMVSGPVVVDQLIDNHFHDISMVGRNWAGVGLAIGAEMVDTPLPFPVVRRARGNEFFGNDIGVAVRSTVPWATPLAQDGLSTDFGTAADPGNNTFRCNSTPPSLVVGNETGADVFITFETPPPPGPPIPFEGNVWDHAPPTVIAAQVAPPGADISFATKDAAAPLEPMVDVADASVDSMRPCPVGRVPGP